MASSTSSGPVVVTGGAGAIGNHLVRSLLSDGVEVRVIDNLSSGSVEHLPQGPEAARMHLHRIDVRDGAAIQPIFQGCESVWHLAANPDIRRGTTDPSVDFEHGTVATFQVLEAARRADVKGVLFSSSSVVYGFPKVFPTPEEYGPLMPESQYGASKLAGEGLISAFAHSYGFKGHIFRFANVIGPGMTHGVLPDFFEKLRRDPTRLEVLGDGRQSKSYLRVEDCVSGMRLAQQKSQDRLNILNLGTADRTSVREIAEWVVAVHGDRARIEYVGGERGWVGDIPQQLLSIERIRRLGWTPRFDSATAIHRTIDEMVRARAS